MPWLVLPMPFFYFLSYEKQHSPSVLLSTQFASDISKHVRIVAAIAASICIVLMSVVTQLTQA